MNVKGILEALITAQIGKTIGGAGARAGAGGVIGGLSRMLATRAGSAVAGILVSMVLGGKGGRGASIGRLGGLAAIGALAWQAYQSWQAEQGKAAPQAGEPRPTGSQPAPRPATFGSAGGMPSELPPAGSPLAPETEEGEEELSRILMRAMISAAKADGHIDETEGAAIAAEVGKLDLSQADRDFLTAELNAPLDVTRVARGVVGNPQLATAVYAASQLAITVDTDAERAYLAELAKKLELDPALVSNLQRRIADGAPAA